MKTGTVGVIGRANVGKSSLVNALTGMKVSIVSPKPQTTRDKILGVVTDGDIQIIFADTPGIHTAKNALDKHMNREINAAVHGADAVLLVTDANRGLTDYDLTLARGYKPDSIPFFAALNKVDLVPKHKVFPQIQRLKDTGLFDDIFFVSARRGDNLGLLLDELKKIMPEGDFLFGADDYTDKSVRFMLAETVREKILFYLNEEVPHGVRVEIESMDSSGATVKINALIVCEKTSHKQIIIGKGGEMLGKIGEAARKAAEKMLDKKVYLETYVKVIEDWRG
ncbi:MAG: GTPase Era [Firmicutes bacterium]|nr:GTPase Era [Bacillota bacterium]